MSMATTYVELRKLSTEELIRRYDELAARTALLAQCGRDGWTRGVLAAVPLPDG